MSFELYISLQLLLLCVFVGGTSTLLIMTVINRMRVRRVLMSWQHGRSGRWPIGATAFVAIALILTAYTGAQGSMLQAALASGYLVGGIFWWGAAFLTRTVLISAYGIVGHVNRDERVLAWSQVTDYFVVRDGGHWRYTFFYRKDGAQQRFMLRVPAAYREAFQQVVRNHVDARFEFEIQRRYGRKALEE